MPQYKGKKITSHSFGGDFFALVLFKTLPEDAHNRGNRKEGIWVYALDIP